MMYDEFMNLAGYSVTYDDYKSIIEPMYMEIPASFTKKDFVKMIDKKFFTKRYNTEILFNKLQHEIHEINREFMYTTEHEINRTINEIETETDYECTYKYTGILDNKYYVYAYNTATGESREIR